LAGNTVDGGGKGARSGAQTLLLLAAPLNVLILKALEDWPRSQPELRRELGFPAQSTLRAQLRRLEEVGAVEKDRTDRSPASLDYGLTAAGNDLLFVADVLERWLGEAPAGSLQIGTSPAKRTITALAEGWSTTMLRALAAKPLSLTELDGLIGSLNYPALERRLNALRVVGQVEARPGNGRSTPCAATDWLRQGVAPLVAACRWEHRHLAQASARLGRIDIEATFLLAMPLLRLAEDLSGGCRLTVELQNGRRRSLAGVLVEVEAGRTASCATRLQGSPDAWASGTASAWLASVVEQDRQQLELGGDTRLAGALLEGLHKALFRTPQRVQKGLARAS
jgi:DNA-binding HxlR family transcriptional regulator